MQELVYKRTSSGRYDVYRQEGTRIGWVIRHPSGWQAVRRNGTGYGIPCGPFTAKRGEAGQQIVEHEESPAAADGG